MDRRGYSRIAYASGPGRKPAKMSTLLCIHGSFRLKIFCLIQKKCDIVQLFFLPFETLRATASLTQILITIFLERIYCCLENISAIKAR